MQIRGWDELTDDQRGQAALLDWTDWAPPTTTFLLHERWIHGRPYQEYSSLVAIEGRRVLARVGVIRVELRDREGSEPVLGVSDVITDPSALRRGLATRLVAAAHEQARSEGLTKAFLGTRRSWGAHRGYEKIGYVDVYSGPRLLRAIPAARSRRSSRFHARRGRRSDVPLLQSILDAASVGRVGFIPRSPRSFEARFRLRWREPKDYLILLDGRTPVGYASLSSGTRHVLCTEAVPIRPSLGRPLLDAIERTAAGKWLGFGTTTFMNDLAREFHRRRYLTVDRAHSVLMVCPLRGSHARGVQATRTLFEDPKLFLHQPDTL
jgi:GNAT superfamily N-acetyltransferase